MPRGVEEADGHARRVVVAQADGEAAERLRRPHEEAGDRDGGHLEVEHVDPGRVEAGHHRPLQHPRRAARVARGDDGGALAEARAVGHARPSIASSGVMSTLASPPTPSRPNSDDAPSALPDDRRVDDRAVLDRLERVDLHVRAERGVRPDVHLVAEHDALVGADVGADVRRPARRRCRGAGAATPRRRCRAGRTRSRSTLASTRPLRAEHGVLAEAAAGLDRAVRARSRPARRSGRRVRSRRPRRARRRRRSGSPGCRAAPAGRARPCAPAGRPRACRRPPSSRRRRRRTAAGRRRAAPGTPRPRSRPTDRPR